jgi:hypothetical protein
MKRERPLYGLLAEFLTPEEIKSAAERTHAAGYRCIDAFSPFPVDGLGEAIGFKNSRVALVVLIGGLLGGLAGYGMMYYSAVWDYPIVVAGRPLHSIPAFIPITFELTVLGASLFAVLGMLALNGLPRPHHPLFNAPRFELASRSRFFLLIESADDHFDEFGTRHFLESLNPAHIEEVRT